MAWGKGNYSSSYATNTESVVEDGMISEMLAEFGKFNQDFFITKIMSKSIDMIGTDPQRFVLLIDMLELSLLETDRFKSGKYTDELIQRMKQFEKDEGKEPQDMEKKLNWQIKRAGIKFSLIFGKLANTQPVEAIGVLDPQEYIKLDKNNRDRHNARQNEKNAEKREQAKQAAAEEDAEPAPDGEIEVDADV